MKRRSLSFLLLAMMLLPLLPAKADQRDGLVRVLLTRAGNTDRIELALDGSYTVNELSFQRGSRLTVSAVKNELYVYYEGMAFDAGKQVSFIRHAVEDGKENGLRLNGGYELHPGDLTISAVNGQVQSILTLPVEEYLLGVVPYEMSDSYPLEALKSQAIAARTYVMSKARQNAKAAYDVVDNTNDQVYYGSKKENDNAAKAIRETEGVCGYYKNNLAMCYYSASNGGQTELAEHVWGKGDFGYLAMTDDPYDLENKESVVKSFRLPKTPSGNDSLKGLKEPVLSLLSEAVENMGYDGDTDHILITSIEKAALHSPMFEGSKIMTKLDLSLKLQGRRLLEADDEEDVSIFAAPVEEKEDASGEEARQPQWSSMQSIPQTVTLTLDVFPTVESACGLSINGSRNEIITLRETDAGFTLESRRYGHGVGLSQRGAQCMARDHDFTYDQILKFYYPGMTLKKLSYHYSLPDALSRQFLATPGPAASPTPRPTLMPVISTPAPGQYRIRVSNIGVNSYLNLRQEPNTQAVVVRQLYYGQELIVVKELGEWLQVRTDDVSGYVMAQFTSKAE